MRHRVKEHTPIELDIEKDLIFLSVENVIDQNTLKDYENKIEKGEEINLIDVFKTRNRKNILEDLNTSGLVPLIREAEEGEWMYIVTDGNHRATAHVNKKKNIPAYLIWVDK